MNIDKIDNGYTISYSLKVEGRSDWESYSNHQFAFTDWDGVVDFIKNNETKVIG